MFFLLALPAPGTSTELFEGTNEDDSLIGSMLSDRIEGGDGNDWLLGSSGDDQLWGEAGDDVLIGGPGIDQLYGGDGEDQFVIILDELDGADEVVDFDPAEDSVVLRWGLPETPKKKKKLSSKVDIEDSTVNVLKFTVTYENVRVNDAGDVEVRFEGEKWERAIRLNHSRLKVKIKDDGEDVKLYFDRKF